MPNLTFRLNGLNHRANALNRLARWVNRQARILPQFLVLTSLIFGTPGFASQGALPPLAPTPTARPDHGAVPFPTEASLAAGERECRARLRAMGVSFSPADPVAEEAGCRIDHPVLLRDLGPGVALEPEALVNCAVAETAVRFVREVVSPEARRRFGAGLVAVGQASGYVCRPRNGTAKLSEHASGNAIDLSSFTLDDGRVIAVVASSDRSRRDFLRSIRGGACGLFRTVLGPGSDADHADHLHLDLVERRADATYCR